MIAFKLLSCVTLCVLASSGSANATLIWDWSFGDAPANVGPTDTVYIPAIVTNNSLSTTNFVYKGAGVSFSGLIGTSGDRQYDVNFGRDLPFASEELSQQWSGLKSLAPGESFAFTFATLSPYGTVLPGTYGIANTGATISGFQNTDIRQNPTNQFLFTVQSPSPPPNQGAPSQILYLDFEERLIPVPSASLSWLANDFGVYTKPKADLDDAAIQEVVDKVTYLFRDFNVLVTTTLPTSDEYSTIHVGGSLSDIPDPFGSRLPSDVLGIAEQLDFDNKKKTDIAHVFSEDILSSQSNPLDLLALIIAHEAGHILGLQHVVQSNELMAKNTGLFGLNISDIFAPTFTQPPLGTACQNSFQELGRNLGFADNSITKDRSFCEALGRDTGLTLSFFDNIFLYGVTLAIIYDTDTGPTFISLGDITSENGFDFDLLINSGLLYGVFGSSTPGGPIDVFASSYGTDVISQFMSLEELENELFTFPIANESGPLGLYRYSSFGNPEFIGSLMASIGYSVPEPSTISLLVISLLALIFFRAKGEIVLTRRIGCSERKR